MVAYCSKTHYFGAVRRLLEQDSGVSPAPRRAGSSLDGFWQADLASADSGLAGSVRGIDPSCPFELSENTLLSSLI